MDDQTLTRREIARIQRAASYAGFDWQLICTRPTIAMDFCRRVEAEMQRNGIVVDHQTPIRERPIATSTEPKFVGVA